MVAKFKAVASSIPLGGIVRLAPSLGTDVTIEDMSYLQSGFATTAPHASLPKNIPSPVEYTFISGLTPSSLRAIAADGAGVVVAIDNTNSNKAVRSTDYGETWSVLTMTGTNYVINDVTYANGTWIAVGSSDMVARSTDGGLTWTKITSGVTATLNLGRIATDGNGAWMASSVAASNFYVSVDDGLTWTARSITTFGGSDQAHVASDGNGVWVAVGGSTTSSSVKIARSTNNGTNWVAASYPLITNEALTCVATDGNGVWLALGTTGLGSLPLAYRSTDNGLTWNEIDAQDWDEPSNSDPLFIKTNGTGLWIYGNSYSLNYSLNNGESWALFETGNTTSFQNAVFAGDYIHFAVTSNSVEEFVGRSELAFGINIAAEDAETYYVRYL